MCAFIWCNELVEIGWNSSETVFSSKIDALETDVTEFPEEFSGGCFEFEPDRHPMII